MMDAIKFAKDKRRMCQSYYGCVGCDLVPLGECSLGAEGTTDEMNKTIIEIVEKWAEEHPAKTRQGEFLKLFPNARLAPDGLIMSCVRDMDGNHPCDWKCIKCRNDYWLEEVE